MNKKNILLMISVIIISTTISSLMTVFFYHFLLKDSSREDVSQKGNQRESSNSSQPKKKYFRSDGIFISEHYKGISLKEFSLKTINNKIIPINKAQGKLSILYFWTSTCPYCKSKTAKFREVAKIIKKEKLDIKFITINLDLAPNKAEAYIKEANFNYPFFFDVNRELSATLKITGVPNIFLLDKDLRVIFNIADWPTTDSLIKKLKSYL